MTRTVEYEPSPRTLPKSKSLALSLPLTELFRDLECGRERGALSSVCRSSLSSEMPNSLARYAGGREPRGVLGDWGLRERGCRLGDENVRIGRGGWGDWTVRSEVELELEDEEMTEAFLLKSAKERACCGFVSGDGDETWTLSIRDGLPGLNEWL